PDRERKHHRVVVGGGERIEKFYVVGGDHVVEALAILWNEGVHVHQPLQPFGDAVGHARDDHAAIAVSHQANAAQVFAFDIAHGGRDGVLQAHGASVVFGPVAGQS